MYAYTFINHKYLTIPGHVPCIPHKHILSMIVRHYIITAAAHLHMGRCNRDDKIRFEVRTCFPVIILYNY